MKHLSIFLLLSSLWCCSAAPPAALQDSFEPSTEPSTEPDTATVIVEEDERTDFGHAILYWIPNRIFDALDIVRARARIGPGFSISLRATELLDLNMGSHSAAFVGLPGPRGEPRIPWLWGTERIEGLEIGWMGEADEDLTHGPRYGAAEFGAGIQVIIVGADAGVDVFEAFDLVTGIFFIDLCGDDL